jgi:hypothetical protein
MKQKLEYEICAEVFYYLPLYRTIIFIKVVYTLQVYGRNPALNNIVSLQYDKFGWLSLSL